MCESGRLTGVRPRVLLVSPIPPPLGGIARWTRALLDMDQQMLGAKLTLIDSSQRKQHSDESSFMFRVLGGLDQFKRVLPDFLSKIMRDGRPSSVHLNTSGSLGSLRDIALLLICRILRIRSILHLRFGRVPDVFRRNNLEASLLRLSMKLSSVTLCLDKRTLAAIRSTVPSHKAVLVPNFIQMDRYTPKFRRGTRNVLFLGSVERAKGVVELLEAWEELDTSDWTLHLVGPISDSICELIEDQAHNSSVKYVGPVDHEVAINYMYDAECLILPSHTEGFPNVILEAMATGTPIIATDVGAISEMLDAGTGIVVPPRDPEALRDALADVMSGRVSIVEMARRAHRRALRKYDVNTVLATYRRLWDDPGKQR